MRFLHQKRILHRDLKPENLLYKDNDPGAPLKVSEWYVEWFGRSGG